MSYTSTNPSSSSIKKRLVILCLSLSVIPMLIMSAIAMHISKDRFNTLNEVAHKQGVVVLTEEVSKDLEKLARDKITVAQSLTKHHLDEYFKEMLARLDLLIASPSTLKDLNDFDRAFSSLIPPTKSSEWLAAAKKVDHFYTSVVKYNQWYDVFLVDTKGWITYTQARESDLGMSLTGEVLKNSGLGQCFNTLKNNPGMELSVADYAPYAPSNGDQAAFMMRPVKDASGKLEGYLAFQISSEAINSISQQRTGLGQTGESYLVGRTPDGKAALRSDRVVKTGKIGKPKFDPFIDAALNGKSGIEIKTGSTGTKELVCFAPLSIKGLNWAIITTIGVDEVMKGSIHAQELSDDVAAKILDTRNQGIAALEWSLGLSIVIATLIGGFISYTSANKLAKPIAQTASTLKEISEGEGDLTSRLEEQKGREDEMGQLARYFNVFIGTINTIIADVQKNAQALSQSSAKGSKVGELLSKTAEELKGQATASSAAVEQLSNNLVGVASSGEQISMMMNSVSSAVGEMAATTREMSTQCTSGASQAREANEKSRAAGVVMDQLTEAASKIGAVVDTIDDIADRTDLLALNATIEAASAGEAGKGFAVVAVEIKELSRQTQDATGEIAKLIQGIRGSADQAAHSSQEISQIIEVLSSTVEGIAAAVEEMAATASEISSNVTSASSGADSIATIIKEASTGAMEVSQGVAKVNTLANQTEESANDSLEESNKLNDIASQLGNQVKRFKV